MRRSRFDEFEERTAGRLSWRGMRLEKHGAMMIKVVNLNTSLVTSGQ
jgi:hypothetical protein